MGAGYTDVIHAIIAAEQAAVGDVALQQVAALPFITANEDTVEVADDVGPAAVREVLARYKKIQGRGAYGIARRAMRDLLTVNTELDLPAIIIPMKIREERFISGF